MKQTHAENPPLGNPKNLESPQKTESSPYTPSPDSDATNDGRHDFDFLHGTWNIRNRRLARRLEGCTEWQEFEATQEVRPILGGIGNIDRFLSTFPDGTPIEGMTLRIFDPHSKRWSLYWADNRSCALQPPVIGAFHGDSGEFTGDDEFKGKPIKVVFRWKVAGPNACHWEQAFSADGGKSWEMNWEMTMTRSELAQHSFTPR